LLGACGDSGDGDFGCEPAFACKSTLRLRLAFAAGSASWVLERCQMRNLRLGRAPRIRLDSAKATHAVFYSAVQASNAAFILYALTVYMSTNIVENPIVERGRLGQYLQVSHCFVPTVSYLSCCLRHDSHLYHILVVFSVQ
jgi:hypothetical protein